MLARKYTVVHVGLTLDPVRGEGGLRVLPEQTFPDVRAEEFEAALIPGGVDLAVLADVPGLVPFLRDLHARQKVLAAVCGGPFVLGRAGILEELDYTVIFDAEQRAFLGVFPEAGFEYRHVVRPENVITAQGHAFAEFGLSVA